ncbi:isoleucine--tRNA ligase [Candidatus Bandiella euplotis]|uniref:Isoleucine--tRNA ligase n=1 Tax=Candidatus Bandiella euplotis TaxID=1664265 RepID=A0ABZ0UQM6_9RICK|nr:isoleucine--tRNA ligase [Candidatus Bandiella woodruffii]WPX97215.1 Isoleucine--tRNA ligase [Candidatus Bandiella woodruffii]
MAINLDADDFNAIEKQVLKKWHDDETFEQSLRGEGEFVFYDGPPFANGLPHYGHLLTGFIKDLFARYQTMKGKKVDRRFGWDCHGLPAEMYSEKELGISGKVAIEKYGIDRFNQHCKESVLKYTNEWQEYVNRQARWVDFKDDYKTMDKPYMESVIWAFSELYKAGLIYQSMRVMPYSWACETPVSDFETRMDNAYREKHSKAVTLGFKLKNGDSIIAGYGSVVLAVWTTTPWTLPSNLAIAVGREIDYVAVEKEGKVAIIAENLLPKYAKELGSSVIKKFKGAELIGLSYIPPFEFFKDHPKAFTILAGDFVTTDDGTGIVHIAPGFGEDDQILCEKYGIELVCPVDAAGKFTYPVEDYVGKQVFETNDDIIIRLKNLNLWIKTEQYIHNYPHCWRTDTPLIYKAVSSWYVKVTAIKDKMIENNKQINWIPEHIKAGLFGKWLENARDWSISRNRFWGCPIPIWQSDDPKYPHIEVYGSVTEIEESFGVRVDDLHRPFIDDLTKPNPKDPTGQSKLRRVPEVLDCWFESGSMPYAQMHYPFENKEWFENHFPADFIVEYLAQTRGWFYTMTVLSTALFDRPPFLNCICHGVILGDGGQKLSKRLKNYPDPKEVFEKYGADAMRWFMMSSPVMKGQELVMDKDANGIREAVKTVIKPLWNAFNFFSIYSKADKVAVRFDLTSTNVLDKYIIGKLANVTDTIQASLDKYDTVSATKAVEEFLEVLNNWYIRRSRERFWRHQKDQDKLFAYNTLYSVLHVFTRSVAPLLPLITEAIFSNLDQTSKSVHLELYPDTSSIPYEETLINNMEKVRDACNTALRIRNERHIRVRQPLAKVTFIGVADANFSAELKQLVLDEINVKSWVNLGKEEIAQYADYRLKISFPMLAKRLPQKVKDIVAANKEGNWRFVGNSVEIAGCLLNADEFELLLEAKGEYKHNISALSTNDALVLVDLEVTRELELEGIARDIVRAIQQTRKEMDLNITDKIYLEMSSDDKIVKESISKWHEYIKEQTLAIELKDKIDSSQESKVFNLDGGAIRLHIKV